MLLALLQQRLLAHIRNRVRTGQLTERGLARMAGMSQPHLHNVLKGIRTLSQNYADRIISHLDLSLSDLLTPAERGVELISEWDATAYIPLLRGAAGPAAELDLQIYPAEVYPVTRIVADSLINPVLVRLAEDSLLFPFFREGDLALVTRPVITTDTLENSGIYLVQSLNRILVRSVRLAGTRLYLLVPPTFHEPRRWDSLPLRGQDLSELIKGRLVWIQRQLGSEPIRPGSGF